MRPDLTEENIWAQFAKMRDPLKDSIPTKVLDSEPRYPGSIKLEPQINMADCEERLSSGSADVLRPALRGMR
jgi:hypothetical protein